jgi:hypothetical protein
MRFPVNDEYLHWTPNVWGHLLIWIIILASMKLAGTICGTFLEKPTFWWLVFSFVLWIVFIFAAYSGLRWLFRQLYF